MFFFFKFTVFLLIFSVRERMKESYFKLPVIMFSLLLSLHFETEHTMVYVCLHSGQSLMLLHYSEFSNVHAHTRTLTQDR